MKKPTLSYYEFGQGKPIVLLHGFLCSSQVWHSFALQLSSRFRVVCIDFPGHGKSECNFEELSITQLAQMLRDFMIANAIENPILCGHSMGGYVALDFLKYDFTIAGLCLLNSNPCVDSTEKTHQRMRELRLLENPKTTSMLIHTLIQSTSFGLQNDSVAKLHIESQSISNSTMQLYINAMMQRENFEIALKQTNIPLLVIQGELDVKQPNFEIPNYATVKVIPQSGHFSFLDHEQECCDYIFEKWNL